MRLIDADALTDFLKCLLPERGMWEIDGDVGKNAVCETVAEAIEMVKNMETIKPETNCSEMPNNSDCISRQAAIDAIEETDWYHQNRNGEMVHGANSAEDQPWYKADDVYNALGRVPSVDAVEVVRCKDCKYFDSGTDEDGKLFFKCLGWVYGGTSEDDFCSHGERRDGRLH